MEFNQAYDPIRALQTSWQVLKKAPLPLLIGGVILVLTDGGGGGGGGGNFNEDSFGGNGKVDWDVVVPVLIAVFGLVCCLGAVFFALSSWVRVGFANTVEEVVRTGNADVGRVFDGKGRVWAMILSRLLVGLILLVACLPFGLVILLAALVTEGFERNEEMGWLIGVGGCLLYFPVVVYVGLGLCLAKQAVALEGLQPVESIRRSWSLVDGHRWMLLLYWFVTSIFAGLGICLCCIGIFLTGTMRFIAESESYLAYTRGKERDGWWIQTGTPPASAEPKWGSPAELPQRPVGWGAPPPPPPPPPT